MLIVGIIIELLVMISQGLIYLFRSHPSAFTLMTNLLVTKLIPIAVSALWLNYFLRSENLKKIFPVKDRKLGTFDKKLFIILIVIPSALHLLRFYYSIFAFQ